MYRGLLITSSAPIGFAFTEAVRRVIYAIEGVYSWDSVCDLCLIPYAFMYLKSVKERNCWSKVDGAVGN